MLLIIPCVLFGQAPNLGSTSGFAVFTAVGAVNNIGPTMITGDIGTNAGPFNGFPPGIVNGAVHVTDAVSTQAAMDVQAAYGQLSGLPCGAVLGTNLGNNQTLTPNVYCLGAATTLNGNLILDGQNDPNSIFIFQIDGAFATGNFASVTLIDSASLCNVYWQVNGQFTLGQNAVFRGTLINDGAIILLTGATIFGRALSVAGAVNLDNNIVTLGLPPVPSVIVADGPVSFCIGDSVTLSGNIGGTWSTGDTAFSIVVTTPGDYFVINTSICNTVISNHIIVTVNPLPVCQITGSNFICEGQTTQLCEPAGPNTYLWSTGAMTDCITINTGGTYSVTVTSPEGCTSTCSHSVTLNQMPACSITGTDTICEGETSQICVPPGASAYLWSTGANSNCITVNTAGTYTVTITNASGCTSTCSLLVTVVSPPVCTITGTNPICEGASTQLCAPPGAAAYLWSTGGITNCITVNIAGTYSITVTNSNGCSSTCSFVVEQNSLPSCLITGNNFICQAGQSTQLCAPPGAAAYLWSTGEITGCIDVSLAGTYTVVVTGASGCTSSCSQTVTVDPTPSCSITGNTSLCDGESTQLCVPVGAASYLWSTGEITNCITVGTSGTFTVTVTNAGGCTSVCSTSVTVNPIPICNITGNSSICQGGSTQLCVPVGAAAYLWSTGEITNCITVNTTGTYSVTVTGAGGCSSTCSIAVSVNPLPDCSITGDNFICQIGQSTQLCVLPGAASYLWSTGAMTNCILVSAAGTFTVTVTNASGCTSSCSQSVTVNAMPSCTMTGDDVICDGQTTQLCVPPGAAAYLWSTGETTNCITVSTGGSYTVTVTNSNGCMSTCNKTILVNQVPSCTITGVDSLCEGQSALFCAPSGTNTYLWSTGASTSCIQVTATGNYFVTVTNAGGCSSTCSKSITVNPEPNCMITGLCFFCQGDTSQLCAPAGAAAYLWNTGETTSCITISTGDTFTVTVTNSSGCTSVCSKMSTVYDLPNCTITGVDSICQGDTAHLCAPTGATCYLWSTGVATSCISVVASGTYTVTVMNAGGCTSSCSMTVVVSPMPNCTITGEDFICQVGQVTQLCAPPGAAAYLWSTGATTNCINVSAAGTFTVTVTNASGCTSSCSMTVMVDPLPSCTILGNDFICVGQTTQLCSTSPPTSTFLWSTGETTGCITVSMAGTYYLTVTNASGCISTCNRVITLVQPPSCLITGSSAICQGETTQLCAPAGAASYVWSTGATVNCITVSAAGTYTVVVTNASGCVSTCSQTVTVNPLPGCAITGNNSICEGQSTDLCASLGFASYLWNTGSTNSCITTSVAGTYTITVTNSNGCSSSCSINVFVNPLPICSISGNNTICQGQSTELCAATGTNTYLWSTGSVNNCITVGAAGTYSVTVTNASGCSSTCSMTVSVNPLPDCTITGNTSICEGQTTQLCSPAGAASYLWSTGSTTNCTTVNAAGTFTVTVTSASGCTSTCSTTVTMNALPACSITGDDFICQDGQPSQLCAAAGFASYLWSTGETTNCVTINAAGTYSVTVTNASGCTSSCNITIVIHPLPNCTITGNSMICEGETTQLCVPAGAASYLWSTGSTSNCTTVNAAGTYSVTVTNASGCISTCNQTVVVNPVPVCTITGNATICAGQTTELCVPAGAASYLWSTGATTNCITVSTAGNYFVTVTNASGCSSVCSMAVVVNPLPLFAMSGNAFICQEGQITELCIISGPATYLWSTGSTSACITVNATGTYSFAITDANGCVTNGALSLALMPLSDCSITGNTSICEGQSTELCVPAGAAAYLWSTGATTNCITVNAAGVYGVTITEVGGCTSTCSKMVIMNPLPPCTITDDVSICEGQSALICAPTGCFNYLWNTGATTSCIMVSEAGTYFVTVTNPNGCSSVCSRTVSVIPLPVCTISGNHSICQEGQSTLLCAAPGYTGYLWSTGATTSCITVNASGTFTVTVSNSEGCTSRCDIAVTVNPAPNCEITGDESFCEGQSTLLCAPVGCYTYLWSTGSTNCCILVSTAGTYSLTITNASGCSSVCSKSVSVNPLPVADISGDCSICAGQSTQLCAASGFESYLWNTGETTDCITTSNGGHYSVVVTNTDGCSSISSLNLSVSPALSCSIELAQPISAPNATDGQLTAIVAGGAAPFAFYWSNGQTNATATNLGPGTYTVTVSEANNCQSVCSFVLTAPPVNAVMINPSILKTPLQVTSGTLSLGANPVDQLNPGTETDKGTGLAGDYNQVLVYPNPFMDYIQIELMNHDDTPISFELISPEGKVIATIEAPKGDFKKQYDMTSQPTGLYFFLVKYDQAPAKIYKMAKLR